MTQKLPQIYTTNHATLQIRIRKSTDFRVNSGSPSMLDVFIELLMQPISSKTMKQNRKSAYYAIYQIHINIFLWNLYSLFILFNLSRKAYFVLCQNIMRSCEIYVLYLYLPVKSICRDVFIIVFPSPSFSLPFVQFIFSAFFPLLPPMCFLTKIK